RPPLHRLRDVVGAAHPRPRAERAARGAGRRRRARHQLRRADRARNAPRAARRDADAVDGARAFCQLRHRSGDERRARRARGVAAPRDGFLAALRELCATHGALLIFDEVISGFRAGAGGAQQIFGVRPDLTCLGKIIGGGLPVGAYGGRADVMSLVAPAGPVYQAGTLSGNPLAMTAGLWSLAELSPKLYRHLAALGARLAGGLAEAARDAGVPMQVNAFGSLVTPFFTTQPVRDLASAMTADTGRYAAFFRGMLARGIYPPPSQFE